MSSVVPIKSDLDNLIAEAIRSAKEIGPIRPYTLWIDEDGGKKMFSARWEDGPALTDPKEIEDAFRNPHRCFARRPITGYSIDTAKLIVYDGDGEVGMKSLDELRDRLPRTRRARTQSGGEHVIYRNTSDHKFIADLSRKLHAGIDIKCGPGIIIGAGSLVKGSGSYETIDDSLPTPAPKWMIEEILDLPVQKKIKREIRSCGRNDILSRRAYGMRKNGVAIEQIEHALLKLNDELFPDNPLSPAEVIEIAHKKERIEAELPLNDLGNGLRLAQYVADDFRHIADLNQDMGWCDSGWIKDRTNTLYESFKNVIDEMLVQAMQLDSKPGSQLFRHAKNAGNLTKIKAACELARLETPIRTLADEWDRDGDLITFNCGTVLNIRTMNIRPMVREDLIRHRINAPFDPDAKCPEFDYLINHLVDGDQEARGWLLQLWATGLVTTVLQKIIFVLHGAKDSGKTTVVEIVKKVLGEFAISFGPKFITRPKFPSSSGPDPEILKLLGKRAMFIPEFPRGRLDDNKLKIITGNDTMSVRGCHSNNFVDVRCRMTITISSNSKPFFDATDVGMLTRIRALHVRNPINFNKKSKKTNAVDSIFNNEAAGIAALLVRSLRDLIRAGGELPESDRIACDTGRLNTANDRVAMFLEQRCVTDPERQVAKADLYRAYLRFCKDDGHQPFFARSFHEVMKETHGFQVKKIKGVRMYAGVEEKAL